MNSVAALAPSSRNQAGTEPGFQSLFERSPLAAAYCDGQGAILGINPACVRLLDAEQRRRPSLKLTDFIPAPDRQSADALFRELFSRNLESVRIQPIHPEAGRNALNWTAWRVPAFGCEANFALVIADSIPGFTNDLSADGNVLQAQRWEAVGRLAGGVVHDFNNLLTGLMLYSDLLLSSIDPRDRRRRYADEIRSAVLQANGLIRQLLVFSRPQKSQPRSLCLNDVAEEMKDLLTRLIGENFHLDFRLDPDLGLLRIDRAQAQQILINLILNARDAMPAGGRITVETSNCRFQQIPGSVSSLAAISAFPCIFFSVADHGCGMDETTRRRLFEPFFTTKGPAKGTGLGLTTVHNIVTSNRGLIHVESQSGRGTRVMIVFPRASQTADATLLSTASGLSDSDFATPLTKAPLTQPPLQGHEKDQLL